MYEISLRIKLTQWFEIISYLVCTCCLPGCKGQESFGTDYLKLEKVIEMPGVSGRIDHMAINLKDQVVYMAALGNHSIEVIDLRKGAVIHSIKGLNKPQGVAYIPEHNEFVVANGSNINCVFIMPLLMQSILLYI